MMNKKIIAILLLFIGNNLFANVKLPAIFSNGMVLQQQSKIAVWGWADVGEQITINGSWSKKTFTIKTDASGKWNATLQTPKAGGPYTLKVAGSNTIELTDVLIGEVWVCSGQSNMGFSLKGDADAKAAIAAANYPTIRYFNVKRQYGLQKFDDFPGSMWQTTTPATAGSFSAVAYYFAIKIQQELKIPVGLVFSAWGGTPAEAWTPSPVLKNDTILAKYFDRWKAIQDNVGKDSVAYHDAMNAWKKDSTSSKKPEEPQTLYYYNRPWREPSVLFNGMIDPVIPFGIKGVLWYQGESNVGYADEYYRLFSSMINSWRDKWADKKMPFYFVQLAPYGYNDMDAGAKVREAQYEVMKNVDATGMAVTIDVGNIKDIHPTLKKEVGDRLAFIALAKNYGEKNILYKGPECKKAYVQEENIVLEFSSELVVKENVLKGFEIGFRSPDADTIKYINATARIEGSKVIVSGQNIKQIVEVRYAWLLCGEANLFGKEGLPAFPFRKQVSSK